MIVTFNPDMARLRENLESVSVQVKSIVVVDNASDNIAEIEVVARQYSDSYTVKRATNDGIASALNVGIELARSLGSESALLLDQDSVCSPGMVTHLDAAFDDGVAATAPTVADRNMGTTRISQSHEDVNYCITSGSLCRIESWLQVGKYDEQMFIDFVDFDYCLRLRMLGFKIIRVADATLIHEIGGGRKRGRLITYNYSPFRCRHMAADMLYYARKHGNSPKSLKVAGRGRVRTYFVLLRKIVIVSVFERDRFRKSSALIRGVVIGSTRRMDTVTAAAAAAAAAE